MKPKTRKLLEQCVADGIMFGVKRAYKYNERPSSEAIESCVGDAVMHEIDEWFDFDEEMPT